MHKIVINQPNINKSDAYFTIDRENNRMNFGLVGIKGISSATIDHINEMKSIGGEFKSVIDFVQRCSGSKVNKAKVKAFILAGAFDCLRKNDDAYNKILPDLSNKNYRAYITTLVDKYRELKGMDKIGINTFMTNDQWIEEQFKISGWYFIHPVIYKLSSMDIKYSEVFDKYWNCVDDGYFDQNIFICGKILGQRRTASGKGKRYYVSTPYGSLICGLYGKRYYKYNDKIKVGDIAKIQLSYWPDGNQYTISNIEKIY